MAKKEDPKPNAIKYTGNVGTLATDVFGKGWALAPEFIVEGDTSTKVIRFVGEGLGKVSDGAAAALVASGSHEYVYVQTEPDAED